MENIKKFNDENIMGQNKNWICTEARNGWLNWYCTSCKSLVHNDDIHVQLDFKYCPYCGTKKD